MHSYLTIHQDLSTYLNPLDYLELRLDFLPLYYYRKTLRSNSTAMTA